MGKESTTGEVNFAMGESRKAAGGRQKRKKWKKKRVYGLQTVINMDETRSRRFVGTTGYGGDPAETSTRIVYCLPSVLCIGVSVLRITGTIPRLYRRMDHQLPQKQAVNSRGIITMSPNGVAVNHAVIRIPDSVD